LDGGQERRQGTATTTHLFGQALPEEPEQVNGVRLGHGPEVRHERDEEVVFGRPLDAEQRQQPGL